MEIPGELLEQDHALTADDVTALLLADRERIARDLHDHVIQRLFAVGLTLQAALRQLDDVHDVAAHDRIDRAVTEIDAAIADLRSSIFELRSDSRGVSLRGRLIDIVRGADTGRPRVLLRCDGPVDTLVDGDLAATVEAVVREAVSNAVRHSGADIVTITVEAVGPVRVTVIDDGVGIPADTARSGLDNLAARAAELGGSFAIRRGDGETIHAEAEPGPARPGTILEWTVPLP